MTVTKSNFHCHVSRMKLYTPTLCWTYIYIHIATSRYFMFKCLSAIVIVVRCEDSFSSKFDRISVNTVSSLPKRILPVQSNKQFVKYQTYWISWKWFWTHIISPIIHVKKSLLSIINFISGFILCLWPFSY